MPFPYWIRRLVSWFAWAIGKGGTTQDVSADARARFPDISDDILNQAMGMAHLSIQTAEAANLLTPNQQLSDALGGNDQPDSTVTIRALIEYNTRGGGKRYRSVVRDVPWNIGIDELFAMLGEEAESYKNDYSFESVEMISVVPPLLL